RGAVYSREDFCLQHSPQHHHRVRWRHCLHPSRPAECIAMIVARDLNKIYGGTSVVRDVSLTIPRGGITSIIGPNGAGKSTLLALLSRLLPATSGSVHIDELDVAKAPSDLLARRLSILRQDNHLVARLTVRDLVAFGRFPHSRGRLTEEDEKRISASIRYMELEPLADRFLDEMSGGQRQRAFVA